MIRAAFGTARRFYNQPAVKVLLAGAAFQFGMQVLIDVVTELREEVTALTNQVDRGQLQRDLAELRERSLLQRARTEAYPAKEDIDPLGAGDEQPDSGYPPASKDAMSVAWGEGE